MSSVTRGAQEGRQKCSKYLFIQNKPKQHETREERKPRREMNYTKVQTRSDKGHKAKNTRH